MAFLTILVVLLSLSDLAAAGTCGTSGRSCIDRATCNQTTSTCHCKHPYTWGDGFFQCYKRNQVAAEAKNDVHITTFNKETVDFPYPCRYLVTDVTGIEHYDYLSAPNGYCNVMVHAFSKRFRGKIVTYGYDLALSIIIYNRHADDDDYYDRSIRIYGTAQNRVKNITKLQLEEDSPHGPWNEIDEVDNHYLSFDDIGQTSWEYTEDDYKSVFNVPGCGVVITFIPYDTELRHHQKHVPGLSVSFDVGHRYNPDFESHNKVIGLAPTWKGGSHLNGILYGNLTASQSLVRRAMLNTEVIQNQPDKDDGGSCEQAAATMSYCDDEEITQTSYDNCYWMLEEARFIRCLKDHGKDHFSFFQRCVDSHCTNNANNDCNTLVQELASTRCNGSSKARDFLDGKPCP